MMPRRNSIEWGNMIEKGVSPIVPDVTVLKVFYDFFQTELS